MKIISALKVFGIIAGSALTLWGVFTFFDGIRDNVSDIGGQVEQVKNSNDSILVITKSMDERFTQNEVDIQNNLIQNTYTANQVRLVMDSYLDHLKNDSLLTKDAFIKYMEPFLEYIKKNSTQTQTEYGLTPWANRIIEVLDTVNTMSSLSH